MKIKQFFLFIVILVFIYLSFSGCGVEPDITILKIKEYNLGINYSDNSGIKLLCVLFIFILGLVLSSSKKEDENIN